MNKPETILRQRVCNYLLMNYPNTPFSIDFGADVRMSIGDAKKRKELLGKWSKGFPDITIYSPNGAVLIELKATKTVVKSKHTETQRAYHEILRKLGYKVEFACGYEEAISLINCSLNRD